MPRRQFLLQMTGESGAGKSTLALAIGRETGAVVLDKDIVKSRLLDGDPDVGLDGLAESLAAPLHHVMMIDLARSVLSQGFSVVLDGAAFFPIIRQRGKAVADSLGAAYLIIDCQLPDLEILQSRIDSKDLLTSQPRIATLRSFERPGSAPLTEPHLLIDTRRPLGDYLSEALDYIEDQTR